MADRPWNDDAPRPDALAIVPDRRDGQVRDLPRLTVFKRNGGWNWCQDERVVVMNDWLLIGSVAGTGRDGSEAGDIEVTRYDMRTGDTVVSKMRERFQVDDHNPPAILILPDGRILSVYQSHPAPGLNIRDEMRWRVTERPFDTSIWSAERTLAPGGNISYSHVFRLAAENDRVYTFFRGPRTKPNLMVSDDDGGSFRHVGQLLTWDFDPADPRYSGMDGNRPYLKYASTGEDRIHLVAVEDHPRAWTNSVYHATLKGGQLFHSDGRLIGPMGPRHSATVRVDELTRVFQGDENNIAWAMDMHFDHAGHPVILFSTRTGDAVLRRTRHKGGQDHRYFHARWDGLQWHVHQMCHGGTRLYSGEEDYAGLATIDPDQTDIVFASTDAHPVTGAPLVSTRDGKRHFEIFRGRTPDRGRTWTWEEVTANSDRDNIRPTIPIWPGAYRAVVWMRGSYPSYHGYSTDLVGLIEPR